MIKLRTRGCINLVAAFALDRPLGLERKVRSPGQCIYKERHIASQTTHLIVECYESDALNRPVLTYAAAQAQATTLRTLIDEARGPLSRSRWSARRH